MSDRTDANTIPDHIANLIGRVCEPLHEDQRQGAQKMTGVTKEIDQEVQTLTDADVATLVDAHALDRLETDVSQRTAKQWAIRQLLISLGPRAVSPIERVMESQQPHPDDRYFIEVLGSIGDPAVEALDKILFSSTDVYLALEVLKALFSF